MVWRLRSIAGGKTQGHTQRCLLRGRQCSDATQHGCAELMQGRERQFHLRFDADSTPDLET
jgi:hypothetical protein